MKNFKDTLIELLKSDERFLIDSELSLNHVKDSIDTLDEGLLDLLYNNEQTREKFFEKNKNSDYIKFKSKDFKFYLDENKLDNSYTQFENQIGLFFDNKLLRNRGEVVLNFPFKDCILEGGQSSDDGEDIYFEYSEKSSNFEEKKAKRKEVFFNEVLGKDEIDRLKEDKVLVNWKRFTKESVRNENIRSVQNIKRDENGLIKENLIIKGNNLLALHSIKKEFSGKIKLIYIDPPYNTGNDSFKYNDNFNHSTWLTFMKNRLEVAKELLRDDGVIFIQCDDNEQAYLKILMDEVFGRENFLSLLPRITKKAGKSTDLISKNHDLILVFFKKNITLNRLDVDQNNYSLKDEYYNERGGFKLSQTLDYNSLQYNKTMDYEIEINNQKFYPGGIQLFKERKLGKFNKIDWVWRWGKDKLKFGLEKGFVEIKNNRIYTKTYSNATILKENGEYFVDIVKREKNISSLDFALNNEFSNDNSTKHIAKIFENKNIFGYSKPEKLIQRIIEISTQPGDIVLDYHLGSGTTCAVAHKMGRQYIGIEQMDYIETIAVGRLKKVIGKEEKRKLTNEEKEKLENILSKINN